MKCDICHNAARCVIFWICYNCQREIQKTEGCFAMLKPDFIQGLKQNNVSQSPEKTMERLKAIWSPLAKPKRDEILLLCGLKKTSVERAYKTGNVSAKIITAVSQVLGIDPLYIAGISDEERAFDDALIVQFLTDLKYDVSKTKTVKKKRTKPQPKTPKASAPVEKTEAAKVADVVTETVTTDAPEPLPAPCVGTSEKKMDISTLSAELSKLLNMDSQSKLDGLAEDDMVLMLRSLNVQSGFTEDKKNRLALIKCLLLI